MKVPFVDLARVHDPLEKAFTKAFTQHLQAGQFVAAGSTEKFETSWAQFTGAKHAVLANNGTSALFLALECLQLPAGSEVIIPVNTFIATAEAVVLAGFKPVFVDIDPVTYLIDPAQAAKAITKKTSAIIPVNLYGQAVNITKLKKAVRAKTDQQIYIVEDACQSHGAFIGKKPSLHSDLACYSFYPGKNLGALGEAGAVVTNSKAWYDRMLLFRSHGSKIKYHHELVGFNFRANEMEAAFLSIKLQHLTKYNKQRQQAAALYYRHLQPLIDQHKIHLQTPPTDSSHVYHLFEVHAQKRDQLMEYLGKRGVQTGLHYPHPLHTTPAFNYMKHPKTAFPVANDLAKHLVSLPMFAGITPQEVKYVCDIMLEFYANS